MYEAFKRKPPSILILTAFLVKSPARSCGDSSYQHWWFGLRSPMWGWDPLLCRGDLHSWDVISLPIFNSHTWVWDQPFLLLCPSYQSQCGFFIFLVIRLLFR